MGTETVTCARPGAVLLPVRPRGHCSFRGCPGCRGCHAGPFAHSRAHTRHFRNVHRRCKLERCFGIGAWRSPVARPLWERKVPGSNPGAPTWPRHDFGRGGALLCDVASLRSSGKDRAPPLFERALPLAPVYRVRSTALVPLLLMQTSGRSGAWQRGPSGRPRRQARRRCKEASAMRWPPRRSPRCHPERYDTILRRRSPAPTIPAKPVASNVIDAGSGTALNWTLSMISISPVG